MFSFLHLPTLYCGRKMLLSFLAQQVTRDRTHHLSHPPLSISFLGPQIYHSVVCILVQFLMLRLMGRTVTTVLSSFIFQMVRCLVFLCLLLFSFPCVYMLTL